MNIRSIIKRNNTIKAHFYGGRRILYQIALDCLRFKKVDKNKVLFNNMSGKGFADNPRAIAESLHELAPEIKLVWVCENSRAKNSLPPYVSPVNISSLKLFEELSTAGTWVYNVMPARGLSKREDQIYIQTYHGDRTPKKVHYQNIGKEKTDYRYAIHDEMCDYGVTGSKSGEEMFREGIGFHGPLIKEGTPRCDCLVFPDEQRMKSIRKALGVQDTKLLLYAPTFRQGKENLVCGINFDRILSILEKKGGERWALLYRAHSNTHNLRINADRHNVINVSQYPDMADLLMISDLLITDYSSSSGDFSLTGRPIFLYLDETEEYNRKLKFDMENTPYLKAHNQTELEALVEKTSGWQAAENDREIIDFWGIYETGHASQAVAMKIIEHARS